MANQRIRIHKGSTSIFEVLTKKNQLTLWMTGLKKVKGGQSNTRKQNSVRKLVFEDAEGTFEIEERVLKIEKNKKVELNWVNENMIVHIQYTILDQGDGSCNLSSSFDLKLKPWIFNLLGFPLKISMRKQWEKDLERLKTLVEKGA